ncbi:MAG: PHA/PHB synthase family protein [Rhodospirillales bacterium]
MADQQGTELQMPDTAELSKSLAEIAERSQRLLTDWLTKNGADVTKTAAADPLNIGNTFFELFSKMMADPAKVVEAQMSLWKDYMALWQSTTSRMLGQGGESVIEPDKADRRFKDEAWQDNEVFNYIKQSYLLASRWIEKTVRDTQGLDPKVKEKVEFYTRQFVSALSPTNFAMTNPEVIRQTIETRGENLINGLKNILIDLERGKGTLRISQTDYDAFVIGENIATTPGKVIFRNEMMEVIQYAPSTETVVKRPLLFVPAWINKFYIVDMRPKNSWVKWAVDQGHTVFMISWVNPTEELAKKSFEDYVVDGTMKAVDVVEQATGEKEINAVGYCIGGALLASTLAYAAAKGDERLKSGTFFTTMIDYSEPGELGVFIDEATISYLEGKMAERGYLEGAEMASTFNMLRENDLIWSFVINNYLLGNDPFPFDLLYWNSDSTRMPHAMHSFYLRNFYQRNKLAEPGGINLAGTPIDLRQVKVPAYFLSTREDHIAPWKSTYKGTQILSGPIHFTLAASGHIAGVINPPAAKKYCYWFTDKKPPADPEDWLAHAKQKDGSWWPDWDAWVKKHSGKEMVPAREPGGGKLKPLGDAPGPYVSMKS